MKQSKTYWQRAEEDNLQHIIEDEPSRGLAAFLEISCMSGRGLEGYIEITKTGAMS